MEINSLVIQVKSDGITKATQDLNDLSKAAERAEASTDKLAKGSTENTSKMADSTKDSAKKQVDAWDNMHTTMLKSAERANTSVYQQLLNHNDKVYSAIQSAAIRNNDIAVRAMLAGENEQAKALKRQLALEQKQLEDEDMLRYKASQKAVARVKAQIEEEDMLRYKARIKQESDAAAFAERQLAMNASFAAKSAAAQARLVNEAMIYGQAGGDITSRFGSKAAAMATAEGYAKLKAEAEAAAEATHKFSLANAGSLRELLVLTHELSQGSYKRFGGSMMVLANQSNFFLNAVKAVGIEGVIGFTALGVAIVGAVYGITKGMVEMNHFEKSLELTGNMAGLTRDSLHDMSEVLGNNVTGGADKARGVIEALAASGKFTHETMQTVSQSVLEYMHLSGASEEQAIKMFEGMADGVAKWAAKANESYHFLTYEQYAHIDLLEKQNQKTEAIIETSGAFNKAMDDHGRKVGWLVSYYRDWADGIDRIKGWFKSVGAGSSTADDLKAATDKALDLQKQVAKYEAMPRKSDLLDGFKNQLADQMAEVNRLRDKFRKEQQEAARKSADDEIQAQAIEADRAAKLMDKRMRTKEEKRLDTFAENESTRVAVNAGVLSTELAKRGVQYSELAKQAKEADAAEVAQIKLSGKERVSARDNEFQLQQQLAEKYGIKLVTDAKRLEEQKAAIEKEYADPKGPTDDPRSKALQGALSAIDREVQATKKGEQDKLEQIKLGAKAKEFTEESAAEQSKKAVQDAEAAEVAALNKRFDAIKDFHAKTKVEQQAAENYTKETQDKITQVHEAAAAKIKENDATEKARKQKEEDDYLKAINTRGEQEIKTLETSVAAAQKYAREVGKTPEQIQAIRAEEASLAAERQLSEKTAIEDLLKRTDLSAFARKAYEAELVILQRKVELNKELATANLEGTMSAALANMEKLSQEVYKKEKVAADASLDNIIGIETAKTVFMREERQKRLDMMLKDAQDVVAKEKSRGIVDPEAVAAAEANLERVKKKAIEVGQQIKQAFDADYSVAMFKDMSTQFDVMAKSAASFGDNLKNVSVGLSGFSHAFKNLAAAQEQANKGDKEAAANKIGAYGDMAAAASNFFDKQSAGYAGLQKVAQAFHAAQMAMQLVEMAQSAVGAVLKAGQQMGIPGIIAMSAIVAGLGFSVFGHGSGSVMDSKTQQQIQGTGSVLGSPTIVNGNKVELVGVKSESITKSLSILEKNSGLGLANDNSMLDALNRLNENIVSFATLIVRTTNIGNPNVNLNTNNGLASTVGTAGMSLGGAMAGAYLSLGGGILGGSGLSVLGTAIAPGIGTIIGAVAGAILSKIPAIGNLMTSIFGGKQTLQDSGFTMGRSDLASILANGVNASSYANVKTDGGWFSSDKYSTNVSSLGSDANNQFTKIIIGMADTMHVAAKQLGMDGADFTDKLNNFVIDIGNVSLKGLSGDEIQKTLENVFSKLGDDMANYAFADLKQFQKIGEGMLETVSRVANDLMQVQDVFAMMGKTLPSTIAGISAAEKLVSSFGSVESLTKKFKGYVDAIYTDQEKLEPVIKSVHTTMQALGISGVTTNEEFKHLVDCLDLTKDADIQLFNSLMDLAPAFAQVTKAIEDAFNNAQSTYDSAVQDAQNALKQAAEAYQRFADNVKSATQAVASAEKQIVSAYYSAVDKQKQAADEVKKAQADITNSYVDSVNKVKEVQTKIRDELKKVGDSLQEFIDSIDTSDLSGMTSAQQQAAREANFASLVAAAKAGDNDAAAKIPDLAKSILQYAKDNSSTAVDYAREVAYVRNAVDAVNKVVTDKVGKLEQEAGIDPSVNAMQQLTKELADAKAEQQKWEAAVITSGASFTKAADDILANYNDAVLTQSQATAELAYWSSIIHQMGIALAESSGDYKSSGAELVQTLADARHDLQVAQAELAAANALKSDLELKQTTALEDFVNNIKDVHKTAETAQKEAANLLTAAKQAMDNGVAGASAAMDKASAGMTYWGGIVTTTANSIANSVSILAQAAAAVSSATVGVGSILGNASKAANEAAVRQWYATNGDYKTQGHDPSQAEVDYWTNLLNNGTSMADAKAGFDAAAKREASNAAMVRGWYANDTQFKGTVTQAGVDYWVDALRTNSMSVVKQGFAEAVARDFGFSQPMDVNKFANGGAFSNGVVSRPTFFDLGQMGEEGDEAIMPLTNVGGKLGVRAAGSGNNAELVERVNQLVEINKQLLEELANLREEQRIGDQANVAATKEGVRIWKRITNNADAMSITSVD